MATYVYETIPSDANEKPKMFEVQQSMNDAPLTAHPETGEPIRRVILGGYGLMTKGAQQQSSHCCGGNSCCC